jgi:hypothetical protein
LPAVSILLSFFCFYFSPPEVKTATTYTAPIADGDELTEMSEYHRSGLEKLDSDISDKAALN